MFIEMRTYTLRPGTMAAFEERFVEGLQERLTFSKLGGIWRTEVGGINQVIHIWPYDSFEERERVAVAARETGKWPPKTREFINTQESKIVQLAPYSPPLDARRIGKLYEFRTYTYRPGTMPTVLDRFGEVIAARTAISPLVMAGHTTIGPLNQYIHVWGYKDGRDRERLRAEAKRKVKGWPPQTLEFLVKQENVLMVPLACSPLQ